jgi:poly-gamma-glutamate synthase PgsB/CapB
LSLHQQKLNRHLLDDMLTDYRQWRRHRELDLRARAKKIPHRVRSAAIREMRDRYDLRGDGNHHIRYLYDFLFERIRNDLEWLDTNRRAHTEFQNTYAFAPTEGERKRVLLDYASNLNGTHWTNRHDEAATGRWLDETALTDRYLLLSGERHLRLLFALDRLGVITAEILSVVRDNSPGKELHQTWDRLGFGQLVLNILRMAIDPRIHVAALKSLRTSICRIPADDGRSLLQEQTLNFVLRIADNDELDVWLQSEALQLLALLDSTLLTRTVESRLSLPHQTHLPDDIAHANHSSTSSQYRFARTHMRRSSDPTMPLRRRRLPPDDLFVRHAAVSHLIRVLDRVSNPQELLMSVAADPSDFVRQELGSQLWQAPSHLVLPILRRLALRDTKHQVRAGTLLGLLDTPATAWNEEALEILASVLHQEKNDFVLRTALLVIRERMRQWGNVSDSREVADAWRQLDRVVLPAMDTVQSSHSTVSVRRWAAQTREWAWLLRDPSAHAAYQQLHALSSRLRNGQSCRVPRRMIRYLLPEQLGRLLAILSQEDFSHDIAKTYLGYRLVKGTQFGTRCWRIWHEFRHPSPEKRQAFRHTIGRISGATLRAPSQIMGELSPTKVPGEPLYLPEEGGWRPYLPLVDDFISALNLSWLRPQTVSFYTSEGITQIRPPTSPWRRVRTAFQLARHFAKFAQLRNWSAQHTARPSAYIQALQELGFTVSFHAHRDPAAPPERVDDTVLRFFPALVATLTWPWADQATEVLRRFHAYFGSAFENSLPHLFYFVLIVLALFIGKQTWAHQRIRWARKQIPLLLGGWGTRGKSGTERLKAALITGMGHGLVSKTTGCEATFIQSPPFGEPTEVPLFRPYDRATIWEHANILRMAAQFRPSVFLWECMGLVPEYVRILQRQWSRDDLSTITNTYPDHEDLQGPAGHDVANSISAFVPQHGHLLTTEFQMRPILRDACQLNNSTLSAIGWLESGLITDDILQRFSYSEHPDNIALVAQLAQELGCSYPYALKTMADHLVPDLGVLKTYPPSTVGYSQLEFTNGMSANERFGCLGNWQRMGFDQHCFHEEPQVWVSTVVNNRSDRVARSRVFANILVEDIQADRHFLIGDNLDGLRGYIADAWEDHTKSWTLLDETGGFERRHAQKVLETAATKLRQPTGPKHIQDRLAQMCPAVFADPDPALEQVSLHWHSPDQLKQGLAKLGGDAAGIDLIHQWHLHWFNAWNEFHALSTAIRQDNAVNASELDRQFRTTIRAWFDRKFVAVINYHATGEQIIDRIAQETPPGTLHRVMGIQNIKGPGLDFVYRFQDWDTCHSACQELLEQDLSRVERALRQLNNLPQLGKLCEHMVRQTLQSARRSPVLQRGDMQSQLDAIATKLETSQQDIGETLVESTESLHLRHKAADWLFGVLEQYFDVNDATRRRRQADQIYADLQHTRIGRQRAVQQLRYLSKRQKGGWLREQQDFV